MNARQTTPGSRRLWAAALMALLLVPVAILRGASPIPADALLAHIRFLASDELGGRASGSPGLARAGDYIASQFERAGLRPGGPDGGWFQPFELTTGLGIGRGNSLRLRAGRRVVTLELGASYYPLSTSGAETTAGPSLDLRHMPLVFGGYGLSDPRHQYNDYAGLDANGSAVIVFDHEPQEYDRSSRLDGADPLDTAALHAKARAARQHGARLLLVVADPAHDRDTTSWPAFLTVPDAEDDGLTVLHVRRSTLAPLIADWGLDRLAAAINTDLVPRSRPLPGAALDYREALVRQRRTVHNVIGVLPGSDPGLASEAVVIGAHYDHVGLGGRLSLSPERTGEIHNGADDNASGTASIIEMARAAAADRPHFPRTLVFAAFAGEERGLLGSAVYAAKPTVPLAATVAMLNLDMMGRSFGAVDISNFETSPSLLPDLEAAATLTPGLRIGHAGPGAGRSDDGSFLDRKVPAINFFSGFHADYHRPTDDWERIDAEGAAQVAWLALEFAARIAGRADRPAFVAPAR